MKLGFMSRGFRAAAFGLVALFAASLALASFAQAPHPAAYASAKVAETRSRSGARDARIGGHVHGTVGPPGRRHEEAGRR